MLICPKCNCEVKEGARFCANCGCAFVSDFSVNAETPASMADINAANSNQGLNTSAYQGYYNQMPNQPSYNQAWQPPVPQNQPKKKNKGLIIGIVVLVLLVMAGIGMMLEKVFQMQGYGDNGDDNIDYNISIDDDVNINIAETVEALGYSKGTFDGSVYINDWADIKFELPDGYSDADVTAYNSVENSNTECGMYYIADDMTGVIFISYEKLPSFPVFDEEKYLDTAMGVLENDSNITYETTDTYTTINIGGYNYLKAEYSMKNGIVDCKNTFYVRKLDDYMIVLSVVGADFSANDALVNGITSVE